jgi:hypothetical protein
MCDGEQAGGRWLTGAQAVVETGRHENTIRRFIKKSFDIDGRAGEHIRRTRAGYLIDST